MYNRDTMMISKNTQQCGSACSLVRTHNTDDTIFKPETCNNTKGKLQQMGNVCKLYEASSFIQDSTKSFSAPNAMANLTPVALKSINILLFSAKGCHERNTYIKSKF